MTGPGASERRPLINAELVARGRFLGPAVENASTPSPMAPGLAGSRIAGGFVYVSPWERFENKGIMYPSGGD